jgi:hypothetical protein
VKRGFRYGIPPARRARGFAKELIGWFVTTKLARIGIGLVIDC